MFHLTSRDGEFARAERRGIYISWIRVYGSDPEHDLSLMFRRTLICRPMYGARFPQCVSDV